MDDPPSLNSAACPPNFLNKYTLQVCNLWNRILQYYCIDDIYYVRKVQIPKSIILKFV